MPSSPQPVDAAGHVVIAVDPHKASWTAVAVDARLQPLGSVRVPVSTAGYRQLRRFARSWSQARWAIEGARGLGAPLTARLAADDIAVVDVPAKLARRVRLLSSGHGRKTDEADALSVGIAAQTATRAARRPDGRDHRRATRPDRASRGPGAHTHPDHQPAQHPDGPSLRFTPDEYVAYYLGMINGDPNVTPPAEWITRFLAKQASAEIEDLDTGTQG